jgi:hypothetical protein
MAPRAKKQGSGGKAAAPKAIAKPKRKSTKAASGNTGTTPNGPAKTKGRVRKRYSGKYVSRGRGWCSRDTIFEASSDEPLGLQPPTQFDQGSTATLTWGTPSDKTISAIVSQRRHQGFRTLGFRRGRRATFEKYASLASYPDDDDTVIDLENNNFPLLMALSFDIRQNIYRFLLIFEYPVEVAANWKDVCVGPSQELAILMVNKQLSFEASRFLYKNNVFLTKIPSMIKPFDVIKLEYLRYIENVSIDCSNLSFNTGLNLVASAVKSLRGADGFIKSFTLIISPTAITEGRRKYPILELFQAPESPFMQELAQLHCKDFKIVVKSSDKINMPRKIIHCLLLDGTAGNLGVGGWFANDKAAKRHRYDKTENVKTRLRGLKRDLQQLIEESGEADTAVAATGRQLEGTDSGLEEIEKRDTLIPAPWIRPEKTDTGLERRFELLKRHNELLKKVPAPIRRMWEQQEEVARMSRRNAIIRREKILNMQRQLNVVEMPVREEIHNEQSEQDVVDLRSGRVTPVNAGFLISANDDGIFVPDGSTSPGLEV